MPRPTFSTIVLAYLNEGHAAWREGRPASAIAVEAQLGLGPSEGMDFIADLERRGFIAARDMPTNAIGAYRLLPEGLRFVERLTRAVEQVRALPAPAAERKVSIIALLTETAIKIGLERGLSWALEHWSEVLEMVRQHFPDLPRWWL